MNEWLEEYASTIAYVVGVGMVIAGHSTDGLLLMIFARLLEFKAGE